MFWFIRVGEVRTKRRKGFLLMASFLKETFYITTLTLLSLLLPLSFSLIARLSNAEYCLTFTGDPSKPTSFLLSLFLHSKPPILHTLLCVITVSALLQSLTVHVRTRDLVSHPQINVAWLFLCILQVCVGLGIESIISSGIKSTDFGGESGILTMLSHTIFFIGLHEIMLRWTRNIVRPVVDDTLFGVAREERWIERVAMGACFGALWWWRLRDEIGWLVLLLEVKSKFSLCLGMIDILAWCLYYLTFTIGIVRLVRGLIWYGNVLLCRVADGNASCPMNDEKV